MIVELYIIAVAAVLSSVGNAADWSLDQDPKKWNKQAKETIDSILKTKPNRHVAKNLILFIGDGMGIPTVTAGRIRKGQKMGLNGEELVTNMESLPHVGLSKTYNIDAQTADSAGTATAYLCGVKTRAGIIGLNGYARFNDCPSSLNSKVDSILKWAHKAGKSVGVVTTTRITHASPAGAFANVAYREWEGYDGIKFGHKENREGCKDIADQLISENNYINVILGGGRMKFLPNITRDPLNNVTGVRIDNRNLINEWIEHMAKSNKKAKYIWNASEFRRTDFKKYDHILGLLSYNHLRYENIRNPLVEPSLSEMTEKAIELLSQNENGYFLFVEGGRIDHGHHESKAIKALDDFVSFDEAIGLAVEKTSSKDTLVVVSADHSHTFSIGGNSLRGNPILGIALSSYSNLSDTNVTYTSLTYGNGPGGILKLRRHNLTNSETEGKDYIQEAAVYRKFETHGGEDVAIYASGPMSFLFSRTVEQNFIAHAMAYSACIGPYRNDDCIKNRGENDDDDELEEYTKSKVFHQPDVSMKIDSVKINKKQKVKGMLETSSSGYSIRFNKNSFYKFTFFFVIFLYKNKI